MFKSTFVRNYEWKLEKFVHFDHYERVFDEREHMQKREKERTENLISCFRTKYKYFFRNSFILNGAKNSYETHTNNSAQRNFLEGFGKCEFHSNEIILNPQYSKKGKTCTSFLSQHFIS